MSCLDSDYNYIIHLFYQDIEKEGDLSEADLLPVGLSLWIADFKSMPFVYWLPGLLWQKSTKTTHEKE